MQTTGLKQLGAYVREIVLFAVGFWFMMTARGHWEVKQSTPTSVLWDWVVFVLVNLALGALPWPRTRKISHVAIGSFFANWVCFAWITSVVEALVSPYMVEIWPAFLRMLLNRGIIAFAVVGALCAAAALALSRRLVSRRAMRAAAPNPS